MTEIRKRTMQMMERKQGRPPRLPSEYQEVEWISSDNNSYIQTVSTIADAYGGEVDMSVNGVGFSSRIIGNTDVNVCGLYTRGNGLSYAYKNNHNIVSAWVYDGTRNIYSFFSGRAYFNGELAATYYSPRNNPAPARIIDGTTSKVKVYRAKVLRTLDTASFDGIPCYRKSDGVIGMYDLCGTICPLTNTPFYINAGTGKFTKGADLI